MITSDLAKSQFLLPSLDALAHNFEQARLLYRPDTEAPDSVVELIKLLTIGEDDPDDRRHLLALTRLTRSLATSNGRERLFERQVAGSADRLVRDLRDLRLNGRGEAVLASKAIARRVRGPLRVIARAAGVDRQVIDALRAIDQVARHAPELQILSPTVRHELGAGPFALLRELVEGRHVNGAARVRAAGAMDHRAGTDGHTPD